MPLTKKGRKVMRSMVEQYGKKKGRQVFFASKNKGIISGVDKGFYGHIDPMEMLTKQIITTGGM